MLIFALVLIAAALMKAGSSYLGFADGEFLSSFPVAFTQVLFASWIWADSCRRITRSLAIAVLFALFAWDASRLLTQAESCGCFGAVQVSPAASMLIVIACGAAIMFDGIIPFAIGWKLESAAAIGTFLGLTVIACYALSPTPVELVTAEKLLNRPVPFAAKVRGIPSEELRKGSWRLLLVREGCSLCEKAMTEFLSEAKRGTKGHRLALVFVGPFSQEKRKSIPDNVTFAQILERTRVHYVVPLKLIIDDGVITDVNH